MKNWQNREKKKQAKKNRMKKSGRSLLTIIAPIQKSKFEIAKLELENNSTKLESLNININQKSKKPD